jgi:hypothetical protein
VGFAPADLTAIPVYSLAPRRLHLGPFGSGRDLVKFLGAATVGAIVAAVSSAVLWLPFLAVGTLIALVRVEGRTLDDYALGYCRFRWRTSASSGVGTGGPAPPPHLSGGPDDGATSVRAGGIPIAYLPPGDLQRLFEEWRSALSSLDRPVVLRMRGERFSPLPFLPASTAVSPPERDPRQSYRDLVRALLRHRYRRVVDLSVRNDPGNRNSRSLDLRAQVDGLIDVLERLGIPAERWRPDNSATSSGGTS